MENIELSNCFYGKIRIGTLVFCISLFKTSNELEDIISVFGVDKMYKIKKSSFIQSALIVLVAKDNISYCEKTILKTDKKIADIVELTNCEVLNCNMYIAYNMIKREVVIKYCECDIIITVDEFEHLCNDLKNVINNIIRVEGFDCNNFDARFLEQISKKIVFLESIEVKTVMLEMLNSADKESASGWSKLADSFRVKALNGEIDVDKEERRLSNYLNQSNSERLVENMEWLKKNGYPSESRYITVFDDELNIRDGWHRAACLYHMYGNIEVPIMCMKFNYMEEYFKRFFPFEVIQRESKIVIYGAGVMGKACYYGVNKSGYCKIVLWTDSDCINKMKENEKICSVKCIRNRLFDYVLIAVKDERMQQEIKENLLFEYEIDESKIVKLVNVY